MKKIFHKNQVIITSLAFLIAIAGYISYDRNSLGKDKTAKTSGDSIENGYEIDNSDYGIYSEVENTQQTIGEDEVALEEGTEGTMNPGETVLTGNMGNNVDYAASVKLNREQVRSKNKETLMDIVNNTNITEEEKKAALDQMVQMTDIAEKEANAEMMLEAKGFTNVVVSISENECDVVLDMGEVTDAKRAQVEDIVKRKTGVDASNIVITAISSDGKKKQQTQPEESQSSASGAQSTQSTEDTETIVD